MKKVKYMLLLLLAVSNVCMAQVFSVVDSFVLTSMDRLVFLNEDSIYFFRKSAFGLNSIPQHVKWSHNVGTDAQCLHEHSYIVGGDITPDKGFAVLAWIDESCTWNRSRIAKAGGTGTGWHHDFAPFQGLMGGGVFVKNDTINVFASLAAPLPAGQHGFAKYRIDTAGNVTDTLIRIVDYVVLDMLRYSEDSLIFLSYSSTAGHYIAMTDFYFDSVRVICNVPNRRISRYRIQNDSVIFAFNPSAPDTYNFGIGAVNINGEGLRFADSINSLRNDYTDIIKIDSFYIVGEFEFSKYKNHLNIYDEKMNFRMRQTIDYMGLGGGINQHLVLVDDSTLMFKAGNSYTVYLRWDWSQMPPLPTDTIPGDTTKISVPELLKKPQTSLFPNPSSTHFTLQSTQTINHIQVFDLRGALVVEQNVQSTEHQVQLSEAGTYIIHIHLQDGSTERQKAVKMRE